MDIYRIELLALNPKISMHRLSIGADRWPLKQNEEMHPQLACKLEAEICQLIKGDFTMEVQYPTWLANIVLVKEKNWQI